MGDELERVEDSNKIVFGEACRHEDKFGNGAKLRVCDSQEVGGGASEGEGGKGLDENVDGTGPKQAKGSKGKG